jgi:hypothetical protein
VDEEGAEVDEADTDNKKKKGATGLESPNGRL